ncbi:MAG: AAA-like domain-containing protein [Deltaproteobacteria bacterium]|jgi:type II secretory pathway predicted ATPase ExeA|nr:AAA-like domain-containing protein [Deltaproteobacteria bacterium]
MTEPKSKKFNIAGPCDPGLDYMPPAIPRLQGVRELIVKKRCFVLHAPRQTGKTTSIRAFVDQLNKEGGFYAMYNSLETLQGVADASEMMDNIVSNLIMSLEISQVKTLKNIIDNVWNDLKNTVYYASTPILICLNAICKRLDKDLVLFFDEVDALGGDALSRLLSQLRMGYVERDKSPFPRSIVLIGMRNIRDYRIKISSDSDSPGSASPFNIITESLTLPDFSPADVLSLYAQHTKATGQVFQKKAVQKAWDWSEGQPWLVNALASEAVENILQNDYTNTVRASHIDLAADNLVRRRDAHIDSLLAKLHDPLVSQVVESMLSLSDIPSSALPREKEKVESYNDSIQYCIDLGLVKKDVKLRPANKIYSSVIIRCLNENVQEMFPKNVEGKWMDGKKIDMTSLLKEFQIFWALNSAKYLGAVNFLEAAPQLI